MAEDSKKLVPSKCEDGDRRTPPTILYIMGYGRSGSTLLDIMLSNHDQLTSTGSLINLPHFYRTQLQCACGQALMGCGFWSKVLEAYNPDVRSHLDELQSVQERVETRNMFPRLVLGAISDKVTKRYQQLSENLYIAISRTSKADIVVDSSKSGGRSTGRALALSKYTDLDVRAVFLVRDGRGVMWSALKGPGSPERGVSRMPKPVRALRALVSWCVTNIACMASSRLMPSDSVVFVRYEDLVTDTEAQLERIARVVRFDPAPLQDQLRGSSSFAVGHNIAGNRLRFAERIRLNPDFEWQDRLPGMYRALFWLIAGPLALALGYRPGRAYSRSREASLPAT